MIPIKNNKKDEKITTKFETVNDEDPINIAYLDEKVYKIEGHISYIEKDYFDTKLLSNQQSVEEVLSQRKVKTAIQKLWDNGLFDKYDNADEVKKMFVQRRRPDSDEIN